MRIKLTSLILASGAILAAAPSHAQTYDPRYPICMQVMENFGGTHFDCRFTSMPQCQASASGRGGSCLVNPFYTGTRNPPGRADR